MTASYAGNSQYTPATASTAFVVTKALITVVTTPVAVAAGWTLISLPLAPLNPVSAATVLAGVLQSSGGHQAAIYALTNNQWAPALMQVGTGAPTGTNFILQPGQGYLISSNKAGSYTETGIVPASQPTWHVIAGWNLVGVMLGAPGPIHASTVLKGVLQRSGGSMVALSALSNTRWSPSLTLLSSGTFIGQDFTLQPGVGYRLYTNPGVSYTPGTASGQAPGQQGSTGGAVPLPALPPLPGLP
ncbi:MAG TPA: hypothetical protein VHB98_19355 [Chloroflexota bacterium]|nr:hypothetical protein [Chloroflexota bacterium]